jgi:hypothetical protein
MTYNPTNYTVTIKRENQQVVSPTPIPCLILLARPEITAMNGVDAGGDAPSGDRVGRAPERGHLDAQMAVHHR